MRKPLLLALLCGFGTPAVAQTAPDGAAAPAQQTPVFSVPNGRPLMTLGDGQLTIAPLLRLDADAGHYWGQHAYPGGQPPLLSDGQLPGVPEPPLNVRRARLGVQGSYLQDFTYNFTWEFATDPGMQFHPKVTSHIFEAQTAYHGLGWATLRVGAFTLNYTLNHETGSFETLTLERPAIINLANSIAAGDTRLAQGIEARGARWLASGYFSQGVASTAGDSGNRGLVGRAVGLPVFNDTFKLAVGADMSAQFHPGIGPGVNLRLADYPELRLDPTKLLDTGLMTNIGRAYDVGGEVSGQLGRVLFASEFHHILTEGTNGQASPNFRGWYANIAVPLFGGKRRWDGTLGMWTRPEIEPLNLSKPDALGYAEFVARYSYVNLYDTPISGNSQSVTSLTVNYFPAKRVRFSLEYLNGTIRIPGPDRAFQAIAGRLAFNW
jgi:phosphate-selective porin OprO and OprP